MLKHSFRRLEFTRHECSLSRVWGFLDERVLITATLKPVAAEAVRRPVVLVLAGVLGLANRRLRLAVRLFAHWQIPS
jgi:hypothetical protein